MNEEKRRFSPPMVGGSSLLVIFAVLCLTIFALLSMSTVQADRRLGDVAAKGIVGYYEADTQAETILARLRGGEIPENVKVTGDKEMIARYTYRISDTQALCAAVAFHGGLGDDYTILRWQAVSIADWEPDDGLSVWDGK